MKESDQGKTKLNSELREKLLRESQTPLRGPRRVVWIALFGSALIGFFIMFSRVIAGEIVDINDIVIQTIALVLFGFLLWNDRSKSKPD